MHAISFRRARSACSHRPCSINKLQAYANWKSCGPTNGQQYGQLPEEEKSNKTKAMSVSHIHDIKSLVYRAHIWSISFCEYIPPLITHTSVFNVHTHEIWISNKVKLNYLLKDTKCIVENALNNDSVVYCASMFPVRSAPFITAALNTIIFLCFFFIF